MKEKQVLTEFLRTTSVILRRNGVALAVFFKAHNKPIRIKIFRWSIAAVILLFGYFFAVNINFLWLFGSSPSIANIIHPQQNIASEVYSEDGHLMGKYFYENRVSVPYSQISPVLIKSLIATEDARFYKHFGIDIFGSFSALLDIFSGNPRGASTLTQQLVKNLYKTRARNNCGLLGKIPVVRFVIIKTKEMINALKFEALLDKKDIITLYLNTVDFGNNAYGIKTAARTYFNTSPNDLKPEQCALLVGMLKATTSYNPLINKKQSLVRRNVVLSQMKKYAIVTPRQCDSLQKIPLNLKLHIEKINDGEAFYFRQSLIDYLKPWLKENGYDLYADGLKIYTTVNSRMQKYAESAVSKNMQRLQRLFDEHWKGENPWVDEKDKEIPGFIDMIVAQFWEYKKLLMQFKDNSDSINYYVNKKENRTLFSWKGHVDSCISLRDAIDYNMRFLHCGFVALDPETGKVKAWVGGIDYDYFKFDHVIQSKRQPGSTFKTFVYTAAIDNGFGPCDSITDIPVTMRYTENGVKKSWAPHNADWTFSQKKVTLKYAFARSLNSASVQVAEKIGWRKVIEYAKKMGIESPIDTVPSICLGVSELNLLELVNAYCPIANGGNRVTPILVTRIENRFGKTLVEFHPKVEKVLSDETVFLMQRLFLGTMTEPMGTTQALYQFDLFRYNTDIGGKTGTSSNNSDGWFVGITPHLVAGSWVGGEQRCIHFKTSALGEGCKTALPVFGLFMEKVLADTAIPEIHSHFGNQKSVTKREYTCNTINTPDEENKAVVDESELLDGIPDAHAIISDSLMSTKKKGITTGNITKDK